MQAGCIACLKKPFAPQLFWMQLPKQPRGAWIPGKRGTGAPAEKPLGPRGNIAAALDVMCCTG
jgi:hypothetical protein